MRTIWTFFLSLSHPWHVKPSRRESFHMQHSCCYCYLLHYHSLFKSLKYPNKFPSISQIFLLWCFMGEWKHTRIYWTACSRDKEEREQCEGWKFNWINNDFIIYEERFEDCVGVSREGTSIKDEKNVFSTQTHDFKVKFCYREMEITSKEVQT